MPPVLQKNERRSVYMDNVVAGKSKIRSFCVITTAGEDETSEGNPESSKRDAVDVAPSAPAPEDEAAAEPALENEAAVEPTTMEPTTAEPARRGPVASLTSFIGTLVGRIIIERLNWWLEHNHIITQCQAGFRSSYTTENQLIYSHRKFKMDSK